MNNIQRKVLSGLIILCAVLAFATCSPDPDPKVPTEAIVITSIPVEIQRTQIGVTGSKATYKVYVQLSAGRTAGDSYVAKGEAVIDPTDITDGKITITFDNLEDRDGNSPWSGTNWANICVVISPDTVADIFDIDAKVNLAGPSSSSSTVVFNWEGMMSKTFMGIENYKELYGKKDSPLPGIITHDSEILPGASGTKKFAGDEITDFDQFLNNN